MRAFRVALAVLSPVAVLCLPVVADDAGGVLPHRCWQFQDISRDYLLETIPKAKTAGMNRIQLSHNIVMEAEQLWEGDKHEYRLGLIREAVALAHENGLKVDMWTHELSGVPKDQFRDPATGRPVLTPALWKWVSDKYDRLFALVPEMDGLVLTFAETAHALHKADVVSDKSPSQRVAEMIKVINDVCVRHDKLLIIRTFVHHPDELERVHGAVRAVAKEIGDNGHLVVMSKCVPHDWQPYYPFNPVLGDVEGLPQVVEIDLGQEYTGHSKVLHCEPNYVKVVMDYCRRKGVIGAVARIERYDHHALGTPNEVNLHAFGRLLNDPGVSVETLWKEWSVARYGEKAAPHVIRALRRTYDITNLMYFPMEHWVTNHSRFTSWGWAEMELKGAANCKWIHSPKEVLAWHELLEPSADTLIKIDREKELARQLVRESLEDLAEARPYLSDADYAELLGYLELSRDNVEVFRLQQLAFFTERHYQARRKAGDATAAELEQIRDHVREYLGELRQWADRMEARYGRDVFVGKPDEIRHFVKEGEEKLKN